MDEALEEQMEKIYKCKAQVEKHGKSKECNRFLFKMINNNKQMHIKCPACGSYAIVSTGPDKKLTITHIKEGEDLLCQIAQK